MLYVCHFGALKWGVLLLHEKRLNIVRQAVVHFYSFGPFLFVNLVVLFRFTLVNCGVCMYMCSALLQKICYLGMDVLGRWEVVTVCVCVCLPCHPAEAPRFALSGDWDTKSRSPGSPEGPRTYLLAR